MRVCNLGSGSRGNSTYIESQSAKILVDCGLPIKQMELRLQMLGVEPSLIEAIFITHEHSDHIQALAQFVKKYNTKVYIHSEDMNAVLEKQKIKLTDIVCFDCVDFLFKDLIVSPFTLSHDSAYCVGYSFSSYGQKMSIATDTGYLPVQAMNVMLGSDLIYIESNHNEKLLLNNQSYSAYLKKRILSRFGHLSNVDCANAIFELFKGGTTQFVLSHLSEKNNTPTVAINDVSSRLLEFGVVVNSDVYLDVASQDNVGTLYEIKSSDKLSLENVL